MDPDIRSQPICFFEFTLQLMHSGGGTGAQGSRQKKARGAFSSFFLLLLLRASQSLMIKQGLRRQKHLDAELKQGNLSKPGHWSNQHQAWAGMYWDWNGDQYQVQVEGFPFADHRTDKSNKSYWLITKGKDWLVFISMKSPIVVSCYPHAFLGQSLLTEYRCR